MDRALLGAVGAVGAVGSFGAVGAVYYIAYCILCVQSTLELCNRHRFQHVREVALYTTDSAHRM